MNIGYFLTIRLLIIHFVYLLESPRRGDSNKYPKRVFPKNNMGLSVKNTESADFCADWIDIITNFAAVITNVVIKRVHCIVEDKKE